MCHEEMRGGRFMHSNGIVGQTNAFPGQKKVLRFQAGSRRKKVYYYTGSMLNKSSLAKLDQHSIGCPDHLTNWQSELQQNVTIWQSEGVGRVQRG